MKKSHAFSLVELLAVMVIVVLIMGWLVPATGSIFHGTKITQATDIIVGMFNQAHQTALTKDKSIEVRLYQYGDPEAPGESPADRSSWKFRAVQLFEVDDAGKNKAPLGKSVALPTAVILDSGDTSTLISKAQAGNTAPVITSGTTLGISIPRVDQSYQCVTFQFRRDGSTNLSLSSSKSWFVTLHERKYGDKLDSPPANFSTVQVDPINGTLKIYRP